MSKSSILLINLLMILFLSAATLTADEISYDQIPILLSLSTENSLQKDNLSKLLANLITLEMRIQGLTVLEDESFDEENPVYPYRIEGLHKKEGSRFNLDLTLRYLPEDTIIEKFSAEGEVDFNLDVSLRDVIGEITEVLKSHISENRDEVISVPEETGSITQSAPENDTEDKEIIEEEIPQEQEPAAEIEPIKEEKQTEKTVEEPPGEERFRKFSIAAGFSPFLPTGDAGDYLNLGLKTELNFQYRIQTGSGYISLGLDASANYFQPHEDNNSSEIHLISLGPEAGLGIAATDVLEMYFRLSGGATLFMVNRDNEGLQTTIIPHAVSGLGIRINFLPALGLYVSANYSLYFEQSVLITGFQPTAGFFVRF